MARGVETPPYTHTCARVCACSLKKRGERKRRERETDQHYETQAGVLVLPLSP